MKQKERITANQFDQALLEQINHYRGMNVHKNSLAASVCFADLLAKKIFGFRAPATRSPEFIKALNQLVEDARVERAEYEMKEREAQAEEKRRQQSRIIMPGQPGSRGN